MTTEGGTLLQVLICTFADGIRRVAARSHPQIEGVEYIVSWQASDGIKIPDVLHRDDFKIFRTSSVGLASNRNNALSLASAPLLLISDDDVDYSASNLLTVIDDFSIHDDADIIVFRFNSKSSHKNYPEFKVSLTNPPKGYYTNSIEIAFRRLPIAERKIWFNENFGIGTPFGSGEEDIFIKDALDKGLTGIYLPHTICTHDSPTTTSRNLMSTSRPMAKGAVIFRRHPISWPLRMLAEAWREIPMWRAGRVPSPPAFCKNWIKGVIAAKRQRMFPTPDYSFQYPQP